MDIVDPAIDRYLHELASPRDPILRGMEVLAAERSFPCVGPQVGQLLYLLARAISAQRVIELGSGFGYSAYWFARAVGSTGQVVLTESSPELAAEAAKFLERGGYAHRARILVGDALEIIDRLGTRFDIVFNDVDKEQYPRVLDRAAAALRPGGLFISDNMLWQGRVLDESAADASTRGVLELTRLLYAASNLDTTILPIRDGVAVSAVRR